VRDTSTIMLTKYILAGVALVFFVFAAVRASGGRGWVHPQVRAWLLLAAIFSVVSAWLFYNR
jgi:hypothetical protein